MNTLMLFSNDALNTISFKHGISLYLSLPITSTYPPYLNFSFFSLSLRVKCQIGLRRPQIIFDVGIVDYVTRRTT